MNAQGGRALDPAWSGTEGDVVDFLPGAGGCPSLGGRECSYARLHPDVLVPSTSPSALWLTDRPIAMPAMAVRGPVVG